MDLNNVEKMEHIRSDKLLLLLLLLLLLFLLKLSFIYYIIGDYISSRMRWGRKCKPKLYVGN